jgi:hypothetical protein
MSYSDPDRLRNRLIEGISEFMSQLLTSSSAHHRGTATNYNQAENERESLVSRLVHTVFECKQLFNEGSGGNGDLLTPYER